MPLLSQAIKPQPNPPLLPTFSRVDHNIRLSDVRFSARGTLLTVCVPGEDYSQEEVKKCAR